MKLVPINCRINGSCAQRQNHIGLSVSVQFAVLEPTRNIRGQPGMHGKFPHTYIPSPLLENLPIFVIFLRRFPSQLVSIMHITCQMHFEYVLA